MVISLTEEREFGKGSEKRAAIEHFSKKLKTIYPE